MAGNLMSKFSGQSKGHDNEIVIDNDDVDNYDGEVLNDVEPNVAQQVGEPSDSGIGNNDNLFEQNEMDFESDTQTAIALSLQPHYLPATNRCNTGIEYYEVQQTQTPEKIQTGNMFRYKDREKKYHQSPSISNSNFRYSPYKNRFSEKREKSLFSLFDLDRPITQESKCRSEIICDSPKEKSKLYQGKLESVRSKVNDKDYLVNSKICARPPLKRYITIESDSEFSDDLPDLDEDNLKDVRCTPIRPNVPSKSSVCSNASSRLNICSNISSAKHKTATTPNVSRFQSVNSVNDHSSPFVSTKSRVRNSSTDVSLSSSLSNSLSITDYNTSSNYRIDYTSLVVSPENKQKLANLFSSSCNKHAETPKTKPETSLLLTQAHKEKLSRLLLSVKTSSVSVKKTPSKPEPSSSDLKSDESSRHWMDCLDNFKSKTEVLPVNDNFSIDSTGSCLADTIGIMDGVRSDTPCSSDDSVIVISPVDNDKIKDKAPPLKNIKCIKNCSSSKAGISLRKVRLSKDKRRPSQSEKIVERNPLRNQFYSSVVQVKFGHSVIPRSSEASFDDMHQYCLEAALEEGDEFFEYGLDIMEEFVKERKPSMDLVENILIKGLFGSYNGHITVKCYNICKKVWQLYPDLIKLNWDQLCSSMSNLKNHTSDYSKCALFLRLYVYGLEANMLQVSLRNRSRLIKCDVFKQLSVDCGLKNLKTVVEWIEFCLNSDAGKSADQISHFKVDDLQKHLIDFDSPYFLLQDLCHMLELGIDISRNCVEAADKISLELVKVFMYLPSLQQKKLLVKTCSDLLTTKLVQKVLDNYCDNVHANPYIFQGSLSDLYKNYFKALPPKSPLCTPPDSPSENDSIKGLSSYSPSAIEELSMLVLHVCKGYLTCYKKQLFVPIHCRFLDVQEFKDDVSQLPLYAQHFYQHLKSLCKDLTLSTEQNCILIACLSEIY